MRLLLVADVHLDAPARWAGPSLAAARREAIRSAFARAVGLAGPLGAHAVCLAGDVYEHERSGASTAAFLQEVLAGAPCPVLVAPGNHDWLGPASLWARTPWPSSVHVFSSCDPAPFSLADGATVWGTAHRAPAGTPGPFDRGFRVDRGGAHAALLHASERSGAGARGRAQDPHAPFEAAQVQAAGLGHALVGHHHAPVDGPWHTYPGNPEPLAPGEQGPRGAVLLEVAESGLVSRQRYEVASGPVTDAAVDVRGLGPVAARERVATVLAGRTGVVRLALSGGPLPDGVGQHLAGLVVVPGPAPQAAQVDLADVVRGGGVRGAFVRSVLDGVPGPLGVQVAHAGLALLDGREPA